MALVDYADSDDSEEEAKSTSHDIAKGTSASSKPTFKKVVDRSNPHTIRISLPEPTTATADEDEDGIGPPAKRAKVGPGGAIGFNSFLPAPKRVSATNGGLSRGPWKGGLGTGMSLKTGATPGFSREAISSVDNTTDNADKDGHDGMGDFGPQDKTSESLKPDGNLLMFKPLSVARKPSKKKAPMASSQSTQVPPNSKRAQQLDAVPKIALFSMQNVEDVQSTLIERNQKYQPMLYQIPDTKQNSAHQRPAINTYPDDDQSPREGVIERDSTNFEATNLGHGPQSLDAIATDLNLSASAKRQLFGRRGSSASAPNVVNFDTDQEYAANEVLRQAGDQVQHNPVRALAAGKHSLKQLVNAASNQKDALEEQFASGRRNKREAGSKYGW